jgi:hypothetical protein
VTQSLIATVLSCFMAAPALAQGARPDFTGRWSLDVARSDFGGSPAPESITHAIDHNEPNITITTTTKWPGSEPGVHEQKLTTDGKAHINKMPAMGAEQEVTVTGKWDAEKLATSWKFDAKGATVEFNDFWSLSEGGKVLILLRVARTPQGAFTVKTVYNKQ